MSDDFNWDDVKVGDPDPTFNTGDGCDAETESRGFFCTRSRHDDDRHVAGDGDTVLEVWS